MSAGSRNDPERVLHPSRCTGRGPRGGRSLPVLAESAGYTSRTALSTSYAQKAIDTPGMTFMYSGMRPR